MDACYPRFRCKTLILDTKLKSTLRLGFYIEQSERNNALFSARILHSIIIIQIFRLTRNAASLLFCVIVYLKNIKVLLEVFK